MNNHSDEKKPVKDAADALAKCEERVEDLKDENAHLRKSAQAFGDLAERLNSKRRSAKGGGPHRPPPAHQKSLPKKG